MAVVAEGNRERLYLSPDTEQINTAKVKRPDSMDLGELAYYPGYINPTAYGFENIESLFTNRQLTMIRTFVDVLNETYELIKKDALSAGMNDCCGEICAKSYSDAVLTYLSFAIDKLADYHSSICSWHNSGEKIGHTFGMTGMAMRWDYCEANPFSSSSGCFSNMITMISKCICNFPANITGFVMQHDAKSDCGVRNVLVSTDPPYYNNVPYADFSDYFYTWQRYTLKAIYPELFRTVLTPKTEELVADPYRVGGKEKAAHFFESGMFEACKMAREYANTDYPLSIYYAYKQNENTKDEIDNTRTSKGWETMLTAICTAGLSITGTWPINTEMSSRTRANDSNALSSSIVLVCRKRPEDASVCTRRSFIGELRRELRPALKKLQASNIAPVDLAQCAIGPGMSIYSHYSKVLEADGTPMTVRSALQIINQELDVYFNEQDGELDRDSRFCVDLYMQIAFNDMKYGDADTLARAKNTSVAALASKGVLYAQKGVVHLCERSDLPERVDSGEQIVWLLCQQLTRAMEQGGVSACAEIVKDIFGSNGEHAKALAYRLYTIAERKSWAAEAYAYNALVISWPEIQSKAAELQAVKPEQLSIF
jgi:putative DNA methylase